MTRCDMCDELLGVLGWQRHEFSGAAPRNLCNECMRLWVLRDSVLLAAARAVVEAWYAEKSGKTLGEYQDLMKELRTAVEAVGQEEV
jgi:hypothetical protein